MTASGILKAAISAEGREVNDFYPTPPEATRALLPEIADFPRRVWEPACGDGAITRELVAAGFEVAGTDLIDRGWGHVIDFLTVRKRYCDAIVTNPPFGRLASKFIEHALDLETPYIAMLFNVNFWHAKARNTLFNRRPPSTILALTWRLDFTGSARPYFNCIWTVWRPGDQTTVYKRLAEPLSPLEALL